jgi:hypothetical protein
MSLTLRGQKGQKLTTQELDDNFQYLESLSSGPQGEVGATGPQGEQGLTGATGPQGPIGANGLKIPFTASESVNAGKIAQVLFDGTVKEFKIEDLTEKGYFIDSLLLPDGRILFLYVTENNNDYYGGGQTKAKLLTIEESNYLWSEESILIEDFPPFSPFGVNLIWDSQKNLVLVAQFGYSYSSNYVLLKITGDVVTIESEVEIKLGEINSVIWHPILNRYVIAYYDDESANGVTKIGLFQLILDKNYSLNELSSIIYESDGNPVQLKYDSVSNKVTVVPVTILR